MEKVVSLFTVSVKKFKHAGILQLKSNNNNNYGGGGLNQPKAWFVSNISSEVKNKNPFWPGEQTNLLRGGVSQSIYLCIKNTVSLHEGSKSQI